MSLTDSVRFAPVAAKPVRPLGRNAAAVGWTFIASLFERSFFVFVFCAYCYAFLPAVRFMGNEDGPGLGESDPANQAVQALILLVTCFLFYAYWRSLKPLMRQAKGPLLLTALCFVSAAWSDDPFLSFKRAIVLAVTTAYGIYAFRRFRFTELARLASYGALIMGLASVVTIVAFPTIGIGGLNDLGENAGLPRGVFATKNTLGFIMLLCSYLPFWMVFSGGRSTIKLPGILLHGFTWLLCIALAVASHSGTAIGALAIGYAAWAMATVIRRLTFFRLPLMYLALVSVVGAISLIFMFPETAFGLLGKDEGLTGRGVLWSLVWDYVKARPVLGYGYAAFWRDDSLITQTIWGILQWTPPHAHNSVLELLLELGFVGLACVGLFYLTLLFRILRCIWRAVSPVSGALFAMLLTMFAQGFSEANLLHQGDVVWMLSVYFTLMLAGLEGHLPFWNGSEAEEAKQPEVIVARPGALVVSREQP